MIIIIDGYNLIKQLLSLHSDVSEKERRQFLHILGLYQQRKKHKMIVVFDGCPYDWTHKERVSGIKVVYSGRHETADDYIIHYLDEHKTKDIFLVSSDHELCLYASDLDVPSMASMDFFDLVQHAIREPIVAEMKVESIQLSSESDDLDTIMREASKDVPIKKEDLAPAAVRQRPPQRASRLERKLYQKLKKL